MVRDFSVDQQKFLLKINTDLLTQITCINSISICADPHDDHLKMVNPQMDHPQLDYPQLDYPHLDYPHLEYPQFGWSKFVIILIYFVQLGVCPIGG